MTGLLETESAAGEPRPFTVADSTPSKRRRRPPEVVVVLRRSLRLAKTRIGLTIVGLIVGVAIVGPFVASPAPNSVAGPPFAGPSSAFALGTDVLGRSVLSRLLAGGWVILLCALAATAIGVALGTMLGVVAAWRFGLRDEFIMRCLDVLLSFPPIILGLLVVSVAGPKLSLVVLAIALWHTPGSARVVRSVALDVRRRDFVQVAEALGVPTWRIMIGEIVPNITSQILIEFGLRLTWSVGLLASLSFLGFGRQPPAADWGYMIYENLVGLNLQPWGVVGPVVMIALLTIGINFITDGIQRSVVGIVRDSDVR